MNKHEKPFFFLKGYTFRVYPYVGLNGLTRWPSVEILKELLVEKIDQIEASFEAEIEARWELKQLADRLYGQKSEMFRTANADHSAAICRMTNAVGEVVVTPVTPAGQYTVEPFAGWQARKAVGAG